MDDQLDRDPASSDRAPEPEADVEGHSLAISMGLDQLNRAKRQERAARQDEALKPLSQPFPRMRDDRR